MISDPECWKFAILSEPITDSPRHVNLKLPHLIWRMSHSSTIRSAAVEATFHNHPPRTFFRALEIPLQVLIPAMEEPRVWSLRGGGVGLGGLLPVKIIIAECSDNAGRSSRNGQVIDMTGD